MWYNRFGTLKNKWDEVALASQFLYSFCDKIAHRKYRAKSAHCGRSPLSKDKIVVKVQP